MKRTTALLCSFVSLSGCASHLPLPASLASHQACRVPVVKLTANEYDNPDEAANRVDRDRPDRGGSLTSALDQNASRLAGERTKVLVLSGGSLHGAFGAGFFYGWQKSTVPGDETIPTYRIITAVSTGALQSTFILLATSMNPDTQRHASEDAKRLDDIPFLAKRKGATLNGVTPPGSSYLANLAQFYMPDRESDLLGVRPLQRLSPNKAGMLELIDHPAVATMVPLRNAIAAQMGDQTLKGVAEEADLKRKLYVAVADLANGYGYAVDLTRLAQLAFYEGADKEDLYDRDLIFPGQQKLSDRLIAARRCYTDALVASSTVPPGVPPVSMGFAREKRNGHLAHPDVDRNDRYPEITSDRAVGDHIFIDGGAAFAVFFGQLKDHVNGLTDVDMDLIVNGTYYPYPWDKWPKQVPNWDFSQTKLASTDFIEKSADLLQTQVRLFSVQEARRWVSGRGRFRWAFIDNRHIQEDQTTGVDHARHWTGEFNERPLDWPYKDGNTEQSCENWHKADKKKHNSMEFFPQYMRCVLSYGRARGRNPARRWNLCEPAHSATCLDPDARRPS